MLHFQVGYFIFALPRRYHIVQFHEVNFMIFFYFHWFVSSQLARSAGPTLCQHLFLLCQCWQSAGPTLLCLLGCNTNTSKISFTATENCIFSMPQIHQLTSIKQSCCSVTNNFSFAIYPLLKTSQQSNLN